MAKFAFYNTTRWDKLRLRVIERDSGICQVCHSAKGDTAHHIIWVTAQNVNDPNIVWSESNLTTVCKNCHHKIHFGETESVNSGLVFDIDGNLIELVNNRKRFSVLNLLFEKSFLIFKNFIFIFRNYFLFFKKNSEPPHNFLKRIFV